MSEQTDSTTVTEETYGQGSESPKEFQAITSQEDFDKAIQARIARERAKYADYDDAKAAMSELEKIRESQKTEAQKAQERLEAAEKRAAELELKATRAEIAATKGVPASLLNGSTAEELEAAADALIAFRGEVPKGPIVPGQGRQPDAPAGTPADRFAARMTEAGF
jgi:DNA repair exonuclease SbcCD ATPase subunit